MLCLLVQEISQHSHTVRSLITTSTPPSVSHNCILVSLFHSFLWSDVFDVYRSSSVNIFHTSFHCFQWVVVIFYFFGLLLRFLGLFLMSFCELWLSKSSHLTSSFIWRFFLAFLGFLLCLFCFFGVSNVFISLFLAFFYFLYPFVNFGHPRAHLNVFWPFLLCFLAFFKVLSSLFWPFI